ncbi:translation initiation factor eIF-2B [Candidatus Dojkabacteria bacterium]|nr:translation initiation factor eIF-2B [Candidatus Dojkabacteria bacterium]
MEVPSNIKQIISDIESLKIQGATAVAEACFDGIKIYLKDSLNHKGKNYDVFISDVEKVGLSLVNARPNEPLARNGLKYLMNTYKIKFPEIKDIDTACEKLAVVMDDFIKILDSTKAQIVKVGVENFHNINGIVTHCHSSTVENMIKGIVSMKKEKEWFSIVATETRPRYQGRITASNLAKAGIEVLLIADGAVESFISGEWKASDIMGKWGDWDIPVDAVFIGCDQINFDGSLINKVGSFGIGLACHFASKPLYVVGSLLKMEPSSIYLKPKIEMRDPKEVWDEAPEKVLVVNPAFEVVPHQFVTGFVTEFGIIKPEDLEETMNKYYEWMW